MPVLPRLKDNNSRYRLTPRRLQNVYSRDPLIDPFPSAYRTLIDNHSGAKIYVDPENGNDGNDGSFYFPKKNFFNLGAVSSGTMIVHYPGVSQYDFQQNTGSRTATITPDVIASNNIKIVCAPGQVRLRTRNTGTTRDHHAYDAQFTGTTTYGAIIEYVSERVQNYMNAMYASGTKGTMYNCVFRAITNTNWDSLSNQARTNGSFSIHYDNGNAINLDAYACLFLGGSWQGNYSGGTSCDLLYCSGNNSNIQTAGDSTGSAFGDSPDSAYDVSTTDRGVYYNGYNYAWDSGRVDQLYLT